MPEIRFDDGLSVDECIELVYAYSVFPDDPNLADLFWRRRVLPKMLLREPPDSTVSVSAGRLLAFLVGPSLGELNRMSVARFRRTSTAGAMLLIMRKMHELGVHPSVARAASVLGAAGAKKKDTAFGLQLHVDASDAKKAWAAARPVAHIAAAMLMRDDILRNAPSPIEREEDRAALLRFAFGLSHSFLAFGASMTETHVKSPKPLLDAGSALTLPTFFAPVEIVLGDGEPWLRQAILGYKAEARR